MRDNLIKLGAYLILILGIISVITFAVVSIYVFVFYPQAVAEKRVLVGTGALTLGVVVLMVSIGIFEAMIELTRIEKKVDPLPNEDKGDEKNERADYQNPKTGEKFSS